ncbi:MAG TPA: glycosyltransferase family 39 protein [Candidatus Limnocylindria bacterium]|nr:glycosyltransferase family 39 protein [Candidatus Limnocylindria bacterium]
MLIAAALLFPATYIAIALIRMSYPFQLEWLEGLALDHVYRVAHGQPLYVQPTLSFVPFNYAPLYFYLAALPFHLFGEGFGALRLVSFLASLGIMGLLFGLVRGATGDSRAGLLSACLFAATYRLGGAWFDVGRADSLQLLLLLGAVATLQFDRAPMRSSIAGGVLLGLSFLAKQSALVAAGPILLYYLIADRRRFFALAGTFAAVVVGTTLGFDALTGGWYSYFVFGAAGRLRPEPGMIPWFWIRDVAGPLGVALWIGLSHFALGPTGSARSRLGPEAAAVAGLLLCSWWLRMYPGGYDNVLMTGYAAIALGFGLGWHAIVKRCEQAPPPLRHALLFLLQAAVLVQFVALVYDPRAQIPTSADRVAGEGLVQMLERAPAEVLIPCHGYLARRAGKGPSFHEGAFMDVVKAGRGETGARLLDELRGALRARRYQVLVLDTRDWILDEARPYYVPMRDGFLGRGVFWPVTGMKTRPESLWAPKDST